MGAVGEPLSRAHVVTALRAAGCVFAEDEAAILIDAAGSDDVLAGLVARRVAGEPLEVIVGWVEFMGLRIAVDPGVFVPRQRTRFLVEQALAVITPGAVVVDMCCGCGAIGLALVSRLRDPAPYGLELGGLELHAVEVEPAAVANARRNLAGTGRVHCGDLYAALPAELKGRIDVLVANAPYVPSDAVALMPPEAREYEPLVALDGGPDGLGVIRRLIAGAPEWLAPGGFLLFETDESQAATALDDVRATGLTATADTSENHAATTITAQLPS